MATISKITFVGARRDIVTSDNAAHQVQPDAPPEVAGHDLAIGDEYPFVDDGDGNAQSVKP